MVPRFGTDGLRGVANSALTPDVALALARAGADVLGGSRVVIGRDTRRSGVMLEAAMVAGYTGAGLDVELLGVVPTPTVAWTADRSGIAGAMISASHNHFEDNGIKLFASGGKKLTDETEAIIEARFHELLASPHVDGPTGASVGIAASSAMVDDWLDAIVATADPADFGSLSVVVDCSNGAASTVGPEAFRRLGADVTTIGCEPDGVNINRGVGSTEPAALQEAVVARGADAGLAFDGDADRLIAVDSTGALVDGDHILAILATDWNGRGRLAKSTVVVTVMTNLGFRLAMADRGIEVVETAVGDRYVLEALTAGGFSLGGEQSGHVICHDLATTGDGVLAGIQLLSAVVRSDGPLSELGAAAMESVPQLLMNVPVAGDASHIAEQLADQTADAERELGSNGRILVRPSGTEPLLRIMVEHIDATTAERVCRHLVEQAQRLSAT